MIEDLDLREARLSSQSAEGLGRITAPIAAEGWSAIEFGRQRVTLEA